MKKLNTLKAACIDRDHDALRKQMKIEMMEKEITENPVAWITEIGHQIKICINLPELFLKLNRNITNVKLYWKNTSWVRKYNATGFGFLEKSDNQHVDGQLNLKVSDILNASFLYPQGDIKPRFWFRTNVYFDKNKNTITYWRPNMKTKR